MIVSQPAVIQSVYLLVPTRSVLVATSVSTTASRTLGIVCLIVLRDITPTKTAKPVYTAMLIVMNVTRPFLRNVSLAIETLQLGMGAALHSVRMGLTTTTTPRVSASLVMNPVQLALGVTTRHVLVVALVYFPSMESA